MGSHDRTARSRLAPKRLVLALRLAVASVGVVVGVTACPAPTVASASASMAWVGSPPLEGVIGKEPLDAPTLPDTGNQTARVVIFAAVMFGFGLVVMLSVRRPKE